jgi:hypothetical protein
VSFYIREPGLAELEDARKRGLGLKHNFKGDNGMENKGGAAFFSFFSDSEAYFK